MKIVSGGQTGVDRAALDVALKHGIECGGWCPAGRLDEVGRIPDRYPLRELAQGSFADRTLENVKDSDGTLIIYFGDPSGGTKFTIECGKQLQRPHLLIDAAKTSAEKGVSAIVDFVREHKIDILNVAGPRQSEWAGGYNYAAAALDKFLHSIRSTRLRGATARQGSTSMSRTEKKITRSAAPSPGRAARRNRRG